MQTKQLLNLVLSFSLLVMTLGSCSKDNGTATEQPVPHQPAPKPVGMPSGALQTFTIGAGGGQFGSTDGRITVIIPAGAVAQNTSFQLQPINSTCDAGVGNGYRLLPHGQQFNKPVTIRFHYESLTDSIAAEDALAVAYQDQQGVWQMIQKPVIDKANKKLSVTTDHFSDWILITWLKINPGTAVLGANESKTLQVVNFHPYADDLLAPLSPSDNTTLPLGAGVPVPANLIKKWTLNGKGNLTNQGSKTTYKAPASITNNGGATVVAEIASNQHQLLLLAHIKFLQDGVTFSIDGGEWKTWPGNVARISESLCMIAGVSGDTALSIGWPGGAGSFNWRADAEEQNTELTLANIPFNYNFNSYYEDANEQIQNSGGSVTIDKWVNIGEWITGSFYCSPAATFSPTTGKQIKTSTIEGKFRLRRTN
ncbi:hypothetical protein KJS94_14960 [Flavihumibacter rivuli]|uniref:hypothetical protein n=1 Tax=Flavihumibacter rivuli TaxID=2838156 RepID=UPI001BDE8F37|nr:hypothetical protein [Flavihumibacter rivuli]ULQ55948.1 hypothetical protein KJS94_14960 [Flavihumibacter rivuli]